MGVVMTSGMKNLALCSVLLFGSQAVLADGEQRKPAVSEVDGGWFFAGGVIGIDGKTADEQGVGDSAALLDFGYSWLWNKQFLLTLGLSVPIINDKDSFSQDVQSNYGGDVRRASSSINAWGAIIEGAYQRSLNDKSWIGLGGGYRSLSADRSISNCSDCYSEDLSLHGGLYLRPHIGFLAGRVEIEFSALTFLSGDYDNGAYVSFTWR